jgi:hypothetical protein
VSDEFRKDEDVEAHHGGHRRVGANDEPKDESEKGDHDDDDTVEAHTAGGHRRVGHRRTV